MPRVVLILALCAGVTSVDAAPKDQPSATKKKKKKKREVDDRRPNRRTKANMPRGFTWPASRNMERMADACELELDELGVAYKPAKPTGRVVRPMTIDDEIGGITYTPVRSSNHVFDCQLVLALANFAPRFYELGVREIKFGSAFRYTKVRVAGKTKNILSRHALGIALDIYAFVDADGREAKVERDYKRGDDLLRDIERSINDSGQFRILLTPRNDPKSHYDHFHLEANPDYQDAVAEKPAS
jgi:hypothetical protein